MIQEQNMKTFFDLIISDESQLPGINFIKNTDKSIMTLVAIPRVRPHKYLKLTKADGFIFLIFAMINDIVINLNNRRINPNLEMTASFTSDVTSELTNINTMPEAIDINKKAVVYACKVCMLNIRRKGVAPAHIMRLIKDLLQISIKTINHPEEFNEDQQQEDLPLEEAGPSGL